LKGQQPIMRALAQLVQIKAKTLIACTLQAAQTLTQQHRRPATIPTLEVQVGHGDLKDSLQHLAAGGLGFVPELLKAVVAGVPLTGIEKPDGLPKTGIGHQALFL
jgi:hypothetical protein